MRILAFSAWNSSSVSTPDAFNSPSSLSCAILSGWAGAQRQELGRRLVALPLAHTVVEAGHTVAEVARIAAAAPSVAVGRSGPVGLVSQRSARSAAARARRSAHSPCLRGAPLHPPPLLLRARVPFVVASWSFSFSCLSGRSVSSLLRFGAGAEFGVLGHVRV